MTTSAKASWPRSLEGAIQPKARFFGRRPASYDLLNPWTRGSEPSAGPGLPDPRSFVDAASTGDLDRTVKVLPLPRPIPEDLSREAIRGMERLRELEVLTTLRGGRATDLPRPEAGKAARTVRSEAPALVSLVAHVERMLAGGPLFVRAIKLDDARVSTTAPAADREAANLHFDAERSSLADYAEPVLQFYLNAGRLERQFKILPVERATILAAVEESERSTLPLEKILSRFLARHTPPIETIPIETGALAIFDGRRFAHDAGKGDVKALISGRFKPSSEPDLVLALDTVETGHHEGLYRPDLPFFVDEGC